MAIQGRTFRRAIAGAGPIATIVHLAPRRSPGINIRLRHALAIERLQLVGPTSASGRRWPLKCGVVAYGSPLLLWIAMIAVDAHVLSPLSLLSLPRRHRVMRACAPARRPTSAATSANRSAS